MNETGAEPMEKCASRNEGTRRLAAILWILLGAFILRVIGQMLVASGYQSFLPPMEEWQSGLLPYPVLVFFQVLIIILYGKICLDFSRGEGYFSVPRIKLGRGLYVLGTIYFCAMVLRYVLRMTLVPEARWFGGTIPIFLHCVLASFLILVARFHRQHLPVQRGCN